MCLTCGHIGCCDLSVGLSAQKHFENHKHPVIVKLQENRGNGVMNMNHMVKIKNISLGRKDNHGLYC